MSLLKIGSVWAGTATGTCATDSFSTTLKSVLVEEKTGFTPVVGAGTVGGEWHLKWALAEALRAGASREMIASSLSLEFLLRLAGTRQVEAALQRAHAREVRPDVVVVCVGSSKARVRVELKRVQELLGLKEDAGMLSRLWKKNRKKWMDWCGVNERILRSLGGKDSLQKMVIEKCALLEWG
ncbi:MAG: hypothetical protein HY917_04430 [Candidatus Diapherotrites archaeon]|nr:hypothetical protein [Candidatus Diapherotrites archaeon]